MRALLLAAGRGERMRPLSDTTPKPLLEAGGRRLIDWQIAAMARAGVREIVVNTAHLARELEERLGDGSELGVSIRYSREGERAADALETGGGIVKALPLLGDGPFIVASGDIACDFDFDRLREPAGRIWAGAIDAHVVLVDNPAYHPDGDMGLAAGLATRRPPLLTYGNIGVFSPRLFRGLAAGRLRLFPFLYAAVDAGRVGAEHFRGRWFNVGTPAELEELRTELARHPLSLAL
jgi:MurNAc alpha-1-phosphate uridylyltransferase